LPAVSGLYTVTGASFSTISTVIELETVVAGSTGNFSARGRL
jgi:hypothetical protein